MSIGCSERFLQATVGGMCVGSLMEDRRMNGRNNPIKIQVEHAVGQGVRAHPGFPRGRPPLFTVSQHAWRAWNNSNAIGDMAPS